MKPLDRWDRFFHILEEKDPYHHLRSIHNGDVTMNYDHTKPWISHVCIQNWDVKKVKEWRRSYRKPIINDECEYEGKAVPGRAAAFPADPGHTAASEADF